MRTAWRKKDRRLPRMVAGAPSRMPRRELFDNLWTVGACTRSAASTSTTPGAMTSGGMRWTDLIEARTGESCLRPNEDCECLCL